MSLPKPEETKLLVGVWTAFTEWVPPAPMTERIRQRWPKMRVVPLSDRNRIDEELADTDIWMALTVRPQQLDVAKRLKWIHCPAAGVNQLVFPEMRRSGIIVTNGRGIHAMPMGEHVLGMMIALARRFPDAFRYQGQRRWAQQEIWNATPHPSELRGKVVTIVGFGAVGQQIGRVTKLLGMKIIAVTRTGLNNAEIAERVYPAADLEQALRDADCVIVAAPETEATRQMIGEPQFRAMKPSAYFINVARGTLVDEAALIDALQKKVIAGAALDVTEKEPLPPESPLWTLENVFITPHLSAVSEDLWTRQTDLLLDNLERWFSGKELRNRVDLERGY